VTREYAARLAARESRRDALERRHAQLAWARLALVAAAVAIVAVLGRTSPPWLLIPAIVFAVLAVIHARVLNARDVATRAVAFYLRGQARLEDRWQGSGNHGERFRDAAHLYADDLDLFGAGGLFELMATTRTAAGDEVLAGWLLRPAAPGAVRARQAAVTELQPRLDLREDLAVLGPDVDRTIRTDDLLAWAREAPRLAQRWPRVVLPLAAAVSVALIVQWIATGKPSDWLLAAFAAQALLALPFRRAAHHVAHGVEAHDRELRVLALLIERLERESVASPLLASLHARLRASGHSPAEEIHRLARLVEILESGHNPYFAPISALLLLRTQLAFMVERWRARCGPHVPDWLAVVAEYEALAALATYAAEHPDDPNPDLTDGPPRFDGDAVAHPLLPSSTAVANDVRLGQSGPHLLVVSGSNMSGKSTLLRTVGLNAVLAQAGAPVRARRLSMSPLAVGATLRIQDSLQAGRSRFFAEITRISAIVRLTTAADDGAPGVLFLLDELLSGTNSHDRLQGATGILGGLLARGAIGLATTHDLALTAIADRLAPQAANVHFDDRFEHGTLTFDYRVKPGVVQSSNAIALMRAVGLEV
jgi:hypothetical protein